MHTEATGLVTEGGTVACDGRRSALRDAAGLRARAVRAPMDVWWFRATRRTVDPEGAVARFGAGRA